MGLFKGQKPKKLKAPNIEKLKSRHDIEGLVKALDYYPAATDDSENSCAIATAAAKALGDLGDSQAIDGLKRYLTTTVDSIQEIQQTIKEKTGITAGMQETRILRSEILEALAKLEPERQQFVSNASMESEDSREVTFNMPCPVCGYGTNVTVRMDWSGAILSGSETEHVFQCLGCKNAFTVRKDSLKKYTNRFV